jgi:hypothetical protein
MASLREVEYSEDYDDEEGASLLKRDSISFVPIPLADSVSERRASLTRTKIGIVEGISLVVGLQIGGGIFSSPVRVYLEFD